MISASVSWTAPLTDSLVRKALQGLSVPVDFINRENLIGAQKPLQWSTYDEIDHELTASKRDTLLASSYTFRKALIRKHFLSRIIKYYLTKKPKSILNWACPLTFEVEISFADELDEMWTDDLWELGSELETGSSWWILKPGMADRGMGIRLFHTKDDLRSILVSFGDDSDTETDENSNATSIVVSQLRHFVIQEYLQTPLLLDPMELMDQHEKRGSTGRKFHLRAYCVSSGDIKVYLYTRILALFASEAYTPLDKSTTGETNHIDLRPHLTNSSLQTEPGESNVRLLDELEGCHILSGNEEGTVFSRLHIDDLVKQMADVVAEVFRAALQNPVHFQPLPNAFELFGVDFLVIHTPNASPNPLCVKILEINSEPAIELTGPRLNWVLVDLFSAIANVCIEPFFADASSGNGSFVMSESQDYLLKCLDENLRPSNRDFT